MIKPCFNVFLIVHIQAILVVVSLTFGGEGWCPSTLLHVLGVDTSSYIQMGTRPPISLIISKPSHHLEPQVNMLLTRYQLLWSTFITLKQGRKLPTLMRQLKKITKPIRKGSSNSAFDGDAVQTGDLLRFYTSNGLKHVDSSKISYTKQMDQQRNQ